jgi:hypothetical protein
MEGGGRGLIQAATLAFLERLGKNTKIRKAGLEPSTSRIHKQRAPVSDYTGLLSQ